MHVLRYDGSSNEPPEDDIGMEVDKQDGRYVVSGIVRGGAAYRAGIRVGKWSLSGLFELPIV